MGVRNPRSPARVDSPGVRHRGAAPSRERTTPQATGPPRRPHPVRRPRRWGGPGRPLPLRPLPGALGRRLRPPLVLPALAPLPAPPLVGGTAARLLLLPDRRAAHPHGPPPPPDLGLHPLRLFHGAPVPRHHPRPPERGAGPGRRAPGRLRAAGE